jgi:hypothetical protein
MIPLVDFNDLWADICTAKISQLNTYCTWHTDDWDTYLIIQYIVALYKLAWSSLKTARHVIYQISSALTTKKS